MAKTKSNKLFWAWIVFLVLLAIGMFYISFVNRGSTVGGSFLRLIRDWSIEIGGASIFALLISIWLKRRAA